MVREITSTLVPAGVLFAAVFSVGTTFLAASLTGSPAMTPGADGAFATPTGFVIELTLPLAWVFGTCAIPVAYGLQLLSGTGLGGAASAATNTVKSSGKRAAGAVTGGSNGGSGGGGLRSRIPGVGDSGGSGGQHTPSTVSTSGRNSNSVTDNVADAPDQDVTTRAFADGGSEQVPRSPGERTEYVDPDGSSDPSDGRSPASGADDPSDAAAGVGDTQTATDIEDGSLVDRGDTSYFDDIDQYDPNALEAEQEPEPAKLSPEDLEKDMDPERLSRAVESMDHAERGEFYQEMMTAEESNGKKIFKEMMGPAGGAVAGAATMALGVAGAGGAAAVGAAVGSVAIAGTVAYAGKRALTHDSVRQGMKDTYDAATDIKDATYARVQETLDEHQSNYEYAASDSGSNETSDFR